MTRKDLAELIDRIDGRSYPAYNDLRGRYDLGPFMLAIERVQGDPFAAPSRLSISIDHAQSRLPPALFSNRSRRIGAENFLASVFDSACREQSDRSGSGKSGLIALEAPGQEVLERSCLTIGESRILVHFMAGLPANGRRIDGAAAIELLTERIPHIVSQSLHYQNLDTALLRRYVEVNEDADCLRAALAPRGLVAFIANGAILPRASGVDQGPLAGAMPFRSPHSLQVTIELPNAGSVSGMGIPKGITLIVGGGFHGKSTLLRAIERGVYNHCPGDGRELVATRCDAVKSRAEDGRSIANVDLSPFINNLPGGQSTTQFSASNASGSTSQAAGVIEALEVGCRLLLIDEDISATNFLIRDERMRQLITPGQEPITPLVDKVAQLYEQAGVSTIIVMGGSSAYFEVASRIIGMNSYLPCDLTEPAKALCGPQTGPANCETLASRSWRPSRRADPRSVSAQKSSPPYRGGGNGTQRPARKRISVRDARTLEFGDQTIDLSHLEQLVDASQTRAIGFALAYAKDRGYFEGRTIGAALAAVMQDLDTHGLGLLEGHDLAAFRLAELAATLNRLRSLRCEQA